MNDLVPQDGGALLERVIVQGDLSKLSAIERVTYYKQVCERCGLDPLMKPLEFITLNGKLVLYALRAATDQLRKLHHVSIEILKRERVDDTYLVTARATLPDGRADEAMGAVNLKGLAGDALANAFLKCETKAKRRVTLSICGLGMLDETEIETIPGARITPSAGVEERLTPEQIERIEVIAHAMHKWLIAGSVGDAVYEMENAALEADEAVYLWTLFDSKQRSAMKKEQERLRKAADKQVPLDANEERIGWRPLMPEPETLRNISIKGALQVAPEATPPTSSDNVARSHVQTLTVETISDAAKKRLEARISETKLDRETVKQYILLAFGKQHFTELTKEEYRIVDGFVEIMATATVEELAATWRRLDRDDKITLTAAKNARKAELEAKEAV
jgi:hypothetical protein